MDALCIVHYYYYLLLLNYFIDMFRIYMIQWNNKLIDLSCFSSQSTSLLKAN